MPYLIDGHNLIGKVPDISLKDPDDEAKLIVKLRSFCARTGKKAHVIFDHGLPGGKSKLSNYTVKVAFASRPGEADDLMLRRIRRTRDTKAWTVISSDRRVLRCRPPPGHEGAPRDRVRPAARRPAPTPQRRTPQPAHHQGRGRGVAAYLPAGQARLTVA